MAVVYDPMRNELFTATRGQGAQLNGYRLRGSSARDLDGTIIATGFPFKAKQHAAPVPLPWIWPTLPLAALTATLKSR